MLGPTPAHANSIEASIWCQTVRGVSFGGHLFQTVAREFILIYYRSSRASTATTGGGVQVNISAVLSALRAAPSCE